MATEQPGSQAHPPPVAAGDAERAPEPQAGGDPDVVAVPRPPADGEPADADAAAGAAGEPDPDAQLRERAGRADEYLALAQRTQADFENYRKRTARDLRAAEARGMSRLARELLPAFDNLERALAAVEAAGGGGDHLTEGMRLVQAELAAALQRTGIEGYAAKGERFDPVHHEAVAQTPVEGAESGTIVEVLQAGYRLNESILRPARVVVAA